MESRISIFKRNIFQIRFCSLTLIRINSKQILIVITETGPLLQRSLPYRTSRLSLNKSRDSSVGIALGYGLDDRGSRIRFPAGAGNFSLHHRVQNGSGTHPASHPMGTRGSFPGVKAAGAWSWQHLHLVPRSKNEWSYTSTPEYAFMAWCSIKSQGQLYLYLL
jgi:hypothetical protein